MGCDLKRGWVIFGTCAVLYVLSQFHRVSLAMGWRLQRGLLLGGTLFVFGLSAGSGMVMYAHIEELVPKAMAGALTGINLFSMLGCWDNRTCHGPSFFLLKTERR
ncbi:MAG: hypothetical protein DRG31_05755 [Deltaproteobacteria bacterium]|nr:MAG: hypothetical protein DRG31_05755 [Deltaproteobacteria bacterium]